MPILHLQVPHFAKPILAGLKIARSILLVMSLAVRQYIYQAFDVSQDLAFNGGDAQNAVVSGIIDGITCHRCPFSLIHRPEFVNDGYYGNGSSWIADSSNSWVKIDLGRDVFISGVMFGRERVVTYEGPFNDRDPGQFIIAVALTENVYENGDESNDVNEEERNGNKPLRGCRS